MGTFATRMSDDAIDTAALAIPIGRCRELLGEEARALSDAEVERIRSHAAALARVFVEMFSDGAFQSHDGAKV